jgi:hypothetical protein
MGSGGYVLAEWASIRKDYPQFQQTFAALENQMIMKCNADWSPRTCGFLTPRSDQYGRTTILPALFDGADAAQMAHWRQTLTSTGHQTLISGTRTGNVIPEDFKVAWLGLAFPNKQQHISEVKWQIGDRKFGRIDLEEMEGYNKPALIFEDGYIIDEEQSFDLYGYVEGPIPTLAWGPTTPCVYQRIVMLGACYYKIIDRVLGNTGAVI